LQLRASDVPSSVKKIRWPPKNKPVVRFSNNNLKIFARFAAANPAPDTLFALPEEEDLNDFPDQEMDYSVTGSWFRSKYERSVAHSGRTTTFDPSLLHIAVHIRRGDALESPSRMEGHANNEAYFAGVVHSAMDLLEALGHPRALVRVHVFSEPNKQRQYVNHKGKEVDIVPFFKCAPGVECVVMHLRDNAYTAFHHLVMADILVVGQSYFSHFASALNRNVKLGLDAYPYRLAGLPGFVKVANDVTGAVDPDKLRSVFVKFLNYRKCKAAAAAAASANEPAKPEL
jgi:hypothetical protein